MNLRTGFKLCVLVGLCAMPAVLLAAPPYTFTAGQPIRASEINANFAALEARIAASRPDLTRVTVEFPSGVNTVPLTTIPSDAARPYILRQVTSSQGTGTCYIVVGTEQIPVAPYSLGEFVIPFPAGQILSLYCPSGTYPRMTFVFEK